MSSVFVIVIWTTLHQFVGIEPGQYPDLTTCKVALAHKEYHDFHWGQCIPWQAVPLSSPIKRAPHHAKAPPPAPHCHQATICIK